jgi:hypothetical protein
VIDNKWQHGPTRFKVPDLGPVFPQFEGLLPLRVVLDPDVGSEVVLILHDQTDFMDRLKNVKPFRLHTKTGVARNEYGPVGFILFWIEDPENPLDYVVAYDVYVNPTKEAQLSLWRDLAAQTHWHLFLVGARGEQEDLFEFENCYALDEFVKGVETACRGTEMVDFYRATHEFGKRHSVRDIFNM